MMASNDQAGAGLDQSLLMRALGQLTDQLAAVREDQAADREAHRAQIQLLQEHIAQSRTTPPRTNQNLLTPQTTPRHPSPPPIGGLKKRPTLPDPPKFDGTRNNFRAWYLEMQNKLQVDGSVIGGNRDQFAYIFSRLEKTPQGMTVAYVEKGGSNRYHDPTAYMAYLHACYGDPNAQARAIDRLRSLRQKPYESFAAFLPKFEKELADGGGGEWTDAVRVNYLEGALNDTMRDRLISVTTLPGRYPEYVQALQTIGSRLDSLNIAKRQAKSSTTGQRSPSPDRTAPPKAVTTAATEDTMDWEPTRTGKGSSSKDRHLKGKRAKWVDQAELDKRREERRCYRCSRSECRIERCPLKPAWRPTSGAKRGTPVAVTEAAIEEEESSDRTSEDSGKE
jgi:hypothetical protein